MRWAWWTDTCHSDTLPPRWVMPAGLPDGVLTEQRRPYPCATTAGDPARLPELDLWPQPSERRRHPRTPGITPGKRARYRRLSALPNVLRRRSVTRLVRPRHAERRQLWCARPASRENDSGAEDPAS